MGRKRQRQKRTQWFDPARRKFLTEMVTLAAGVSALVVNLRGLLGGGPTARVDVPAQPTGGQRTLPVATPSATNSTTSFRTILPRESLKATESLGIRLMRKP